MPQLIPVAIGYAASAAATAAGFGAATAFTIGSTAVTWASVIGTVVSVGASFAMNAIMSGDRPNLNTQVQDRKQMVRGTTEARQAIYGAARVSGALVYAGSSGANKEFLHLVLALATHRCRAIGQIWLNGTLIEPSQLDANGNITDTRHPLHGVVRIQRFLGDQTAAPADLVAESPDGHTAAHALRECTYLYIRLRYDQERMPNLPNVEAYVEGRTDIWDPRSNTTGYSTNWALCVLHYLRWEHGLRSGLDMIDIDSFTAAANLSDEQVQITAAGATQTRYRLDGAFKLDRNPVDVLRDMLDAGGGMLCRVGGRFRLYGAAYRAPTGTITASDLIRKTEVVPRPPRSDLFNGVKAVFVDPERDWGVHPAGPVHDPAMAAQDGGFVLWRDVELPFVIQRIQAERLSRMLLLRHRDGLVVRATVKFSAVRFCVGQVIAFTDPRLGMLDKPMLIMGWQLDPSGMGITVELREEAPFNYAWTFDQAFNGAPAPNTTLINALSIDAPQALGVTEELYVGQNGAGVRTRAVLRWVPPANPFITHYEVQVQPLGATEWRAVAPTAGETRADIDDLPDGLHIARVRARSSFVPSDWAEIQFRAGLLVAQPPADITGLAVQTMGGMAWLRWDRHPDLDVRVGGRIEIRHSPAASPAWATSTSIGDAVAGAQWITLGIVDIAADRFEPANALPSGGGTLTGNLALQMVNPAIALSATAAGQVMRLSSWVGGAIRWSLDLGDTAAETGSNAGTNFRLARYNDAGAFLGNVLTVDRATGFVNAEGGRVWSNTSLPPASAPGARASFAGGAGSAWTFARGDHTHVSELPDGLWVAQMDYAGVADTPAGSWLNLVDLVIPDRALRVVLFGTFKGQQTVNLFNEMRFNVQLLTSGLTEITNIYAGGANSNGTGHPFLQNGLRAVFNPPDQTGMRLRLRVQKDLANGPFNIVEAYAAVVVVRRL
jgi:hypothetical protein